MEENVSIKEIIDQMKVLEAKIPNAKSKSSETKWKNQLNALKKQLGPENTIRVEMAKLLGVPFREGIENENNRNLSPEDENAFQDLLKKLEDEKNNTKRIITTIESNRKKVEIIPVAKALIEKNKARIDDIYNGNISFATNEEKTMEILKAQNEINKYQNKMNQIGVSIDGHEDEVVVQLKDDTKKLEDGLSPEYKIRLEMARILGIPYRDDIENEYEHSIQYQLDDADIDKFQDLRNKLSQYVSGTSINRNNKNRNRSSGNDDGRSSGEGQNNDGSNDNRESRGENDDSSKKGPLATTDKKYLFHLGFLKSKLAAFLGWLKKFFKVDGKIFSVIDTMEDLVVGSSKVIGSTASKENEPNNTNDKDNSNTSRANPTPVKARKKTKDDKNRNNHNDSNMDTKKNDSAKNPTKVDTGKATTGTKTTVTPQPKKGNNRPDKGSKANPTRVDAGKATTDAKSTVTPQPKKGNNRPDNGSKANPTKVDAGKATTDTKSTVTPQPKKGNNRPDKGSKANPTRVDAGKATTDTKSTVTPQPQKTNYQRVENSDAKEFLNSVKDPKALQWIIDKFEADTYDSNGWFASIGEKALNDIKAKEGIISKKFDEEQLPTIRSGKHFAVFGYEVYKDMLAEAQRKNIQLTRADGTIKSYEELYTDIENAYIREKTNNVSTQFRAKSQSKSTNVGKDNSKTEKYDGESK